MAQARAIIAAITWLAGPSGFRNGGDSQPPRCYWAGFLNRYMKRSVRPRIDGSKTFFE